MNIKQQKKCSKTNNRKPIKHQRSYERTLTEWKKVKWSWAAASTKKKRGFFRFSKKLVYKNQCSIVKLIFYCWPVFWAKQCICLHLMRYWNLSGFCVMRKNSLKYWLAVLEVFLLLSTTKTLHNWLIFKIFFFTKKKLKEKTNFNWFSEKNIFAQVIT